MGSENKSSPNKLTHHELVLVPFLHTGGSG